ncbi:MAG: bifunctional phosphoribosyl-AMP cyclohydrolase/phosphoribosyl-ATP diphosphatase HisIE [Ignavibacteriales bacterium]|nr:bifunctional phosphoribosyl-AMP cyclohydrolase/phosphoribosyl-ATP diphosphatase HisIE [Ignavibacteriales bacterium]
MIDKLNFAKLNGLVPAIIQDTTTNQVLMVGFMNRDAVQKTIQERKVTFWSRTKGRLWQKGETSGNTLAVSSMQIDCDGDALLVRAIPAGPVCHTGSFTCFGEEKSSESDNVLEGLEEIIRERRQQKSAESYTARLFAQGTPRIAQKVGEEAVESVIAAMQNNKDALKEEAADLLYHLLVLLQDQGMALGDVTEVLKKRMVKPAIGETKTTSPAG